MLFFLQSFSSNRNCGDASYARNDPHISYLLLHPDHIQCTSLTFPGGPRVCKGLDQCTGSGAVCSTFQVLPLQEYYQEIAQGPVFECISLPPAMAGVRSRPAGMAGCRDTHCRPVFDLFQGPCTHWRKNIICLPIFRSFRRNAEFSIY